MLKDTVTSARPGLRTWSRETESLSAQTVRGTLQLRKRPPSKTKNRQRESTLLIEGCRVWTRGRLVPASLLIDDGRIVRISRHVPKDADEILRANGLVAFPGM